MNIYKEIGLVLLIVISSATAKPQSSRKYNWDNLPKAQTPVFKTDTVNILNFGAKPDGQTLNTEKINNAI